MDLTFITRLSVLLGYTWIAWMVGTDLYHGRLLPGKRVMYATALLAAVLWASFYLALMVADMFMDWRPTEAWGMASRVLHWFVILHTFIVLKFRSSYDPSHPSFNGK